MRAKRPARTPFRGPDVGAQGEAMSGGIGRGGEVVDGGREGGRDAVEAHLDLLSDPEAIVNGAFDGGDDFEAARTLDLE